jgi:carbonic anhydrase/acetyltransferase-like protein (isoleucine patch superfamily)
MFVKSFHGKKPKVKSGAYVAETATLIGDVEIGENSSVWYGAVLRGDMHYIKIGKNSSVQDNSVMHGTADKYPTIVGDNVSIGHNAIVHGCTIGDNCIIGMGSIILEGSEIGDWCIIGAGAVVPEGAKIPGGSIALGLPAKVVKSVTEGHKARITRNWKAYVKLKDVYLKSSNGD